MPRPRVHALRGGRRSEAGHIHLATGAAVGAARPADVAGIVAPPMGVGAATALVAGALAALRLPALPSLVLLAALSVAGVAAW